MSDWISVTEASEIIGIKQTQVRRLCTSGKLICDKSGAYWIVNKHSAIAYAQSERKPGPKASKYTQNLSAAQLKEANKGYEYTQYEVTVLLTSRQLQHLIEKHGSVSAGLRILINADMK